jgi:hypothetical protein
MMRKRYLEKELTIIFSVLIFSSALAFALDEDKTVRVQGLVMELDLKQNMVVVNEKKFVWNGKTVFHNENGVSTNNIDRLKVNTWVYIVGEYVGLNQSNVAKEIYFLTKFIGEKEKEQYPFIIPFYQRR